MNWKDDLLLREYALFVAKEQPKEPPKEQLIPTTVDQYLEDDPGAKAWMAERSARERAERCAIEQHQLREIAEQMADERNRAAQNWCKQAGEYCHQRNKWMCAAGFLGVCLLVSLACH